MTEVNQLFRSHVTSTAFNLTLSRNMICMLASVADQQLWRSGNRKPENFKSKVYIRQNRYYVEIGRHDTVTPGRALISRGLIYSPNPEWPGIYELTEAGELTLKLLIIAGIVVENQDEELGIVRQHHTTPKEQPNERSS